MSGCHVSKLNTSYSCQEIFHIRPMSVTHQLVTDSGDFPKFSFLNDLEPTWLMPLMPRLSLSLFFLNRGGISYVGFRSFPKKKKKKKPNQIVVLSHPLFQQLLSAEPQKRCRQKEEGISEAEHEARCFVAAALPLPRQQNERASSDNVDILI